MITVKRGDLRLIDANALTLRSEMVLIRYGKGCLQERLAVRYEDIENAPTIDAEPVRHGKWIDRTIKVSAELTNIIHVCSVCEEMAVGKYRYCPHCGARMDAE